MCLSPINKFPRGGRAGSEFGTKKLRRTSAHIGATQLYSSPISTKSPETVERELFERKKKWHSASAYMEQRSNVSFTIKQSFPQRLSGSCLSTRKNGTVQGVPERARRRRSYDRQVAREEQRSNVSFFQAKTAPAEPCDPRF